MTGPPFDPDPKPRCRARPRAPRPAGPAHYSGWLRSPGGPWTLAVRASTWGGCWDALYPIRPPGTGPLEKVVRPGDLHPDRRRRPR